MADIEHVRVRRTGEPVEASNPHKGIHNQLVNTGDLWEVPDYEVAAWPDGKTDGWEVVRADAPAVRKAAVTAEKVATADSTQGAQS